MCVPKRTGQQQANHDAAMRAINRGRRNHPRHHNNFRGWLRHVVFDVDGHGPDCLWVQVRRPLTILACAACALFAASVLAFVAFFTEAAP